MPSVLRDGPYRLSFFSREDGEPPHVHVSRDRAEAKFWLVPIVELSRNEGFAEHEITKVRRIVEMHRERLLRKWHEHFDSQAADDA